MSNVGIHSFLCGSTENEFSYTGKADKYLFEDLNLLINLAEKHSASMMGAE